MKFTITITRDEDGMYIAESQQGGYDESKS